MVSIMSQCPMKSPQRIIREALLTNRVMRDRPACTAEVRKAMHFLAFTSTSASSTQGNDFLSKAQGKVLTVLSSVVRKQATWSQPTFDNHDFQISIRAGLSKKYTNHCVQATAITLWSDSCVPAWHIMSVSGHANEQSLATYNRHPSTSQLKNCPDILSHGL